MREAKTDSVISLSELLIKCAHGTDSVLNYDMLYVFSDDNNISECFLHSVDGYIFVSYVLTLHKSFSDVCSEFGIMVVGFIEKEV